jgi:hypothetical protein
MELNMKASRQIFVCLTWGQIQQVCRTLSEAARPELIKPFENAIIAELKCETLTKLTVPKVYGESNSSPGDDLATFSEIHNKDRF